MRTCTALVLIIAGCALPVTLYASGVPWNSTAKMSSACLGIAMCITGLLMLVNWNEE